jgi:hypothetical protein
MKKILKIVLGGLFLISVIAIITMSYMLREQSIDVDFIPNEFSYCEHAISANDPKYIEIVNWLHDNKDGWVISPASYLPVRLYGHPAFKVNVMKGAVIVSYKTDDGYPQYAKAVQHGLALECEK